MVFLGAQTRYPANTEGQLCFVSQPWGTSEVPRLLYLCPLLWLPAALSHEVSSAMGETSSSLTLRVLSSQGFPWNIPPLLRLPQKIAWEVLFLYCVIKSVIKTLYLNLKSYVHYASMALFKYKFSLVHRRSFSWGWYSHTDVQSHRISVCNFLECEVSLEQARVCVCVEECVCVLRCHTCR